MSIATVVSAEHKSGPVPEIHLKDTSGKINNKPVVEAKNQSKKAWFIVAVVVGSLLVVGVGGFGTLGLLQSHGLISLSQSFQWLTSAIGVVGNTPHMWSLWAMAVVGVEVGGSLIAYGAYKIHKANIEPPLNEDASQATKRDIETFSGLKALQTFSTQGKATPAETKNLIWSLFGDNFDTLGMDPKNYHSHPANSYITYYWNNEDEDSPDRQCFTVIKTPDNTLKCTGLITVKQSDDLEHYLKTEKEYRTKRELNKLIWSISPDNFNTLGLDPTDYPLPRHSYRSEVLNPEYVDRNSPDTKYYTVIKTPDDDLKCTKLMTLEQSDELEQYLAEKGYLEEEYLEEEYLKEKEREEKIQAAFGDHFAALKLETDDYLTLLDHMYVNQQFGKTQDGVFVPEERADRFFTVIKTSSGSLKCTGRINLEQKDKLTKWLKANKYQSKKEWDSFLEKSKNERMSELQGLKNPKKGQIEQT